MQAVSALIPSESVTALCKVRYLCAIIALTKVVWHTLHLQVKKVNLAIQMLINSSRNVHFSSRKINRSCFLEYFLCACLLLKIKTLITNFRDVHKNDCTFLPITQGICQFTCPHLPTQNAILFCQKGPATDARHSIYLPLHCFIVCPGTITTLSNVIL